MFRRVRSKLIFWLLVVTLGTMVPVAVVPYYSLRKQVLERGKASLDLVWQEFRNMGATINEMLEPAAYMVRSELQAEFNKDTSLARAFREGDVARLEELEARLTEKLRRFRGCRLMQVHLLSLKDYEDLDSLQQKDLPNMGLYESKDGTFLLWMYSELAEEDVVVGGLVVGQPIMHRQEVLPDTSSSIGGGLQKPRSPFVLDWKPRKLRGVQIDVIDPADPTILDPGFVKSEKFQNLLSGEYSYADNYMDSIRIDGDLSQALLFPFNNHKGELTGVIILSVARLEPLSGFILKHALSGIVFSTLFAIVVGVVLARSIAHPLNRISRTAKQMARGDLTVRSEIVGEDEIGQLAASFNEMASEVERSHTELAARARELEDSVRLVNAANRELTRIQNRLENILANIRSGVLVIDNVGRVIRANRAALEILGLEKTPNADYREVLGYEDFGELVESSLHRGISIFQREIKWSRDGHTPVPMQVSTVPLLDGGRIAGLVVTFHDLSSIRKLERQLVLQDRLAALGRLSAGVAHEIRNPLGVIKGSAELLRKRFGGMPGEEGLFDFILEEVARLSRVVSDFLNFARPQTPELEKVDVNTVIQRSVQYLEHQANSLEIRREFELAGNLPSLQLDPNLFQQVLLNILLNAQEAMPQGGTIRIRTRRFSAREIAVEIQDTGVGIPPDNLQHIFDPFFTSKDSGSGLGLSVVHQIVSSHSGRIEVESSVGVGTTFRLIFPIQREGTELPTSMMA
ncbi:MAG TPA: ATP-binding protein [bacterium]|nr:ATP-binding protein [bacterium]HQL61804.1 ATP-binding protein [bacterium]